MSVMRILQILMHITTWNGGLYIMLCRELKEA